jgi:hypothetical protein
MKLTITQLKKGWPEAYASFKSTFGAPSGVDATFFQGGERVFVYSDGIIYDWNMHLGKWE